MRIVHVSDCFSPRVGGIESQVGDLSALQAARGDEVHVLTATLGEAGERGGVVDTERGVHVHRLGARLPFDLPVNPVQARLLREALRAVRPDVVHVHAGVVSPFAADGARIALAEGLATAVTWHCMLDGMVPLLRLARGPVTRLARGAALSAVSGAAAERVRQVVGPGVPVDVVPNGIDLSAWVPGPADGPAVPDDDGPLRLVATMRLAPRKRAVPLVHAVADAALRLPPGSVHLTLVGDGPARARVEAVVRERGAEGLVELRGRLPREDLRAVYRRCSVYLAPAELEAFGIAALEARAAGLAVVARAGTGVAEFVADGTDGFLVDDDAGMTEAVIRLAADPVLRRRLVAHNRAVVPDFGWDRLLAEVDAAYGSARDRRAAAQG
ncbi:glycosyltransferase family 4 protein [Cellulomonas endophytica]|uniref:glycosyltransferase family 4 protein n=1 Tax=Cellulomonas endophytica TaxID=2494735 RepID=UPI00101049EA|nr:glycosyltransferase family 4 protein [Cellulomonas endophytica]